MDRLLAAALGVAGATLEVRSTAARHASSVRRSGCFRSCACARTGSPRPRGAEVREDFGTPAGRTGLRPLIRSFTALRQRDRALTGPGGRVEPVAAQAHEREPPD